MTPEGRWISMQVASTAEPPPITSIGRNVALRVTSRRLAFRRLGNSQSLSPLVKRWFADVFAQTERVLSASLYFLKTVRFFGG